MQKGEMLIFICVAVSISIVAGEICELPKEREIIDWDKFDGYWHQTATVDDPLDEDQGCYFLRHTESTPDGGNGILVDYQDPRPYQEIHFHVILQPSKTYLWDKNVGREEWLDHEFSSSRLRNEIENEVDNLFTEHVFYTDYKTYLIDLTCEGNGRKLIWIRGRSQYPSAADILPAINKLKEVGEGWEKVPLFPSGCTSKKPLHLNAQDDFTNSKE